MRAKGHEVFFNTGTDEHGIKIYEAAVKKGMTPQAYVDENSAKFRALRDALNLSFDNFIRTTDAQHIHAAEEFWKICSANGDIYKKNYKSKYCVGCEMEKTDSELVDGHCSIHPNLEIQIIEEENYFFRYSKYQDSLLRLYELHPDLVLPESRMNEIKAFVSRGLQDFSISRLATKLPWGISVPGDPSQVMYVWFDALVSYIAAVGWQGASSVANDTIDAGVDFTKWISDSGGMVQYCGKDNLRPQAAMWQAMTMSAGLSTPERPISSRIIIDGFINSGGQKMSKSLGNVIAPSEVIAEYGVDGLRYIIARELHPFEDSDVTIDRIRDVYNAGLANGLGNLVSRVIQMALTYDVALELVGDNAKGGKGGKDGTSNKSGIDHDEFDACMMRYDIQSASNVIWQHIQMLDQYIQREQPFKKIKTDEVAAKKDVAYLLYEVNEIAKVLAPILPQTSTEIMSAISERRKPMLFPRK